MRRPRSPTSGSPECAFAAGDAGALAAALVRLFSMPESEQRAIGTRGRAWVRSHFNAEAGAVLMLKLYAEAAARQKVA